MQLDFRQTNVSQGFCLETVKTNLCVDRICLSHLNGVLVSYVADYDCVYSDLPILLVKQRYYPCFFLVYVVQAGVQSSVHG